MDTKTQLVIDAASERFERAYGAAQEAVARLVERELRSGKTAAELARTLQQLDFSAFLAKAGYEAEAARVANDLLAVLAAMPTRGRLTNAVLDGLARTFSDSFLAEANAYPALLKTATVKALFGGQGAGTIRAALADALPARHARTLADTALSTFSRAVQREMAEADPAGAKYVYLGPQDDRTRPICEEMGAAGALTLAEIDSRFPGRFVGGGGFNCRHSWVPAESAPRRAS